MNCLPTRVSCLSKLDLSVPILALLVLSGCGESGTTSPPPPVNYTLSVTVRSGVSGSPGAGILTVPAGTSIPYSFTVKPGFESLAVYRDSAPIAAMGTLLMNKNLSLTVGADTILNVTAVNGQLVAALQGILTSSEPMLAYRQLQTLIEQLYATLGQSEAERQLDAARVLAYDPINDADALWRIMNEIGDSLQNEDVASPASPIQTGHSIPATPFQATTTPTTFIYINGINTDPAEANTTVNLYLPLVLVAAGYTDRTLFPIVRSYNVSGKLIQDGSTWTCLSRRALAITVGQWSAARQMAQCFGAVADLGESVRQLVSEELISLPPTADVDHLVQITRSVLAYGSRIVMVAHSQGNLVVTDALKELAASTPPSRLECIGVVSIAPPRLIQQTPGEATVSSLIVRGETSRDILLWFGGDLSVPTVSNPLSDAWDTYLFLQFDLWNKVSSGIQLHNIDHSYLEEPGTRDAVIEALNTQVGQVTQSCPVLAPSIGSLTVTSNVATSWTISPSGLTGSGTTDSYTVTPAPSGTDYTITPAAIPGQQVTVTTSDGPGASLTLHLGERKTFTLDYAPIPPEFVVAIGCGCNLIDLAVVGTDLFQLVGVAGTGNAFARLFQFSMTTGTGTEPLGSFSPGLGARPEELRSDGTYVYWRSGGYSTIPYAINRLSVNGGVIDTLVDGLTAGGHYELYQSDVYFQAAHPDSTFWVQRVANAGGTPSDLLQVAPYTNFTVANDEVFYEDCSSGTIMAQPVTGGSARLVATGVVTSNGCSDEMLVVGGSIYMTQVLGSGSAVLSVPAAGGSLVTRAANLVFPSGLVSDGTYLFLRDIGNNGEVIRFRLSDFARTTFAARSCGGLTLDPTFVYWASELAPAPAQVCYDGGSGPIVRLPKGQ